MSCNIRNVLIPIITGIIFFNTTVINQVFAQGDLLISPKRIIFDGQRKTHDINLSNIGKDSAYYEISFIQIRMSEKGNFEIITEPDSGQYFAEKNLRIFPRKITLASKESQVIKIQATQVGKLPPGEYRSHLYFRSVTKHKPLGNEEELKTEGLSVKITPVFGISIPVIIRVGETSFNLEISEVSFERFADSIPILNAKLNRTGNMSANGDLKVEHISRSGKTTNVGRIQGLSVYTPNITRDVRIELDKNKNPFYESGMLRLTFFSTEKGKEISSSSTTIIPEITTSGRH